MCDLEIVTIYPIGGSLEWGRGIMHSLLGVFTVNLLLTIIAARSLVPWVATRLDRRYAGKGWRLFAGHDFVLDKKAWSVTISSAILGGLSHLGFDLPMHLDTPLLWPWRPFSISALPPGVGIDPVWNVGIQLVLGVPFFWMLWRWVGK
jgi:membrane-bound metal-dependent hydrolase YbcI (DUF457 family)